MSTLLGSYTLKVLTNPDVISSSILVISSDHIAQCQQLGQDGRYFEENGYVVMSFGDTNSFNGQTKSSIFARIDSMNGSFSGVMLDHLSGQRFGVEARLGGDFPANKDFAPFIPLPTFPPTEFIGIEQPLNVNSYYRFDYSGSQIGHVDIGVVTSGHGMSGPSTNLRYPFTNEELLVFGTDRLLTYGAVVERIGNEVRLVRGLYMNPLSGGGAYGQWEANS